MMESLSSKHKFYILGVGFATFLFGFGAPAILNIILFAVHSSLVLEFRSSLNFVSAIAGDGIVLPIINMLVVSFIIRNQKLVKKFILTLSLLMGIVITFYLHIVQALQGLVNWSMPTPWHWNLLGVWHFFYMLSVSSLISFYFLILVKKIRRDKKFPKEAIIIIAGVILFLILLKLDYSSVSL